MKYILDNLIDQKQCNECLGLWFHFNHEGNNAFYRLSPLAPEDCTSCDKIDKEIEKETVYSFAEWVKA